MTTNKSIVFDTSCGIPEEEQREIFAQINKIAEKNRLSLAASADGGKGKKKKQFKAKKSGGLFPVVVNVAAIAVLAGGFLALYTFQGRTDAEVREGTKVYNSAERTLIGEILEETSDIARGELDRLSREQAQTATVEAQMGAFFANLSRAINENNLAEAVTIIRSMRDFLNTPAFQGLRSIQSRKELYVQAINSFEIMVDELRRTQAALATGVMSLDRSAEEMFAQLQEKADQLERDVAEKDRTERTLRADIDRERTRANSLQTQTENLQADVTRETRRAASLQEQLNTRDNTIRNQTATIANRNAFVDQIRNVIQGGKDIDDMSFNELRESTARIQRALQTLN